MVEALAVAGLTAVLMNSVVGYSDVKAQEVHVKQIYQQQEQEVDPWDRQLLAHVIYGESRGCSEKCQRYVGSVVLNRVASEMYPDTIEEVVYQTVPTIQYGCTVQPEFDEKPNETAYQIADELLRYGSVVPGNVVFQSEYVQGDVYAYIDGVYFCEGIESTYSGD